MRLAVLALLGTLFAPFGAYSPPVTSPPPPPANFQTLKIGAGGYTTGLDIASDGTLVNRIDVYGAYLWNGSKWVQLVTSSSLPSFSSMASQLGLPNGNSLIPWIGQGVFEIRIAPSNTQILYMMFNGCMFKSTNQGTNWTLLTGFTCVHGDPNAIDSRLNGQKMAIDPNNANVVYMGTLENGLYQTLDGGTTWTHIASVPNAGQFNGNDVGLSGIAFDPTSGTTGGKTNTILVFSYNNDVYKSTDAGSTWNTTSFPDPSGGLNSGVFSGGVYYAVGNGNNGTFFTYNGTSWTSSTNFGANLVGIAINPLQTSEIAIVKANAALCMSYNTGGSFNCSGNFSRSASDVPWLANVGFNSASGGFAFDPNNNGTLLMAEGIGFWTYTVSGSSFPANTAFTWTSRSAGIEDLNATDMIVPSSGHPVYVGRDRGLFYTSVSPNNYATQNEPSVGGFNDGWAIDYATSDNTFVVTIDNSTGYFSTNSGQNWTAFPNPAPSNTRNAGGSIAASTTQHILWAPSGVGAQPYYSTDQGTTWNLVVLPHVFSTNTIVSGTYNSSNGLVSLVLQNSVTGGSANDRLVVEFLTGGASVLNGTFTAATAVGTSVTYTAATGLSAPASFSNVGGEITGWDDFELNSYYNRRIAIDRGTTDVYYINHWRYGIYKSTDAGATWTRQCAIGFTGSSVTSCGASSFNNSVFSPELRAPPTVTNTLFFTASGGGTFGSTFPESSTLYKSTDGGQTWSVANANIEEADTFGFGTNGAGGYSVYFAGWYNNVYGIYQSDDGGSTWSQVIMFPLNSVDGIWRVQGDNSVYGRVYVQFTGFGMAYK